jgi:hypothetical protein
MKQCDRGIGYAGGKRFSRDRYHIPFAFEFNVKFLSSFVLIRFSGYTSETLPLTFSIHLSSS